MGADTYLGLIVTETTDDATTERYSRSHSVTNGTNPERSQDTITSFLNITTTISIRTTIQPAHDDRPRGTDKYWNICLIVNYSATHHNSSRRPTLFGSFRASCNEYHSILLLTGWSDQLNKCCHVQTTSAILLLSFLSQTQYSSQLFFFSCADKG